MTSRLFLRSLCLPILGISLHPFIATAPAHAQATARAQAPAIKVPSVKVLEEETEAQFDFRCNLVRTAAKSAPATLLLGYSAEAPHLALKFTDNVLVLSRVSPAKQGRSTPALEIARVQQNYSVAIGSTPLVVQWREGNLEVIYDGRTILRRAGLGEIEGAIAVQSSDVQFEQPQFQPVEPVEFSDDFMREASEADPWQKSAGAWRLSSFNAPAMVSNPFMYMAQGKPAMVTTGRWFWNDYEVSSAVRPTGGAVGVVAFYQDAQNYLLFKWHAEDTPKWTGRERQIWRVWKGRPELLNAAPGGYRPGQWYRIGLTPDRGRIVASIDGQLAVEGRCDLFGQGLAGLFSESEAETAFDDVEIRPREAADTSTHKEAITPQFTKEQTMEEWASPKGQWLASGDGTKWHRGVFFGDHALELSAAGLSTPGAKLTAILGGDGAAATTGYALVVEPAKEGKGANVELLRDGKSVAKQVVKEAIASPAAIKLQRSGNTINGFIGDAKVVSFNDKAPLPGRRAGFLTQTAAVAFEDAKVTGGNIYDYTFYRAPTDWHVASGTWDVTSRWLCSPNWSWFSGNSERVAAIWNKRGFSGDFTVDVFASCKMDSATAPYYLHPRDINITIGGDGNNLSSGYSFIFGGENNTKTQIRRGTEIVKETKETLLPAQYHAVAHRKWFNLRVEKTGDTFSYYIDRKLVLTYRDPKPLDGKQIALWTCGNGMMIARATVYYENETGVQPLAPLLAATNLPADPAHLKWSARSKTPPVRVEAVPIEAPVKIAEATKPVVTKTAAKSEDKTEGEKVVQSTPAVRAVNLESGGNFSIKPEVEPFDALKTPHLSFGYLFAPGAAVNLYFKVQGTAYAVRLTGSGQVHEDAKVIGAPKVRDDGKWHELKFDLAGMLKPLYPDATTLMVEEIFFGNLTKDIYLQAGFGANFPGAHYMIRDFTLRAEDDSVVRLIAPELEVPKTEPAKPATAQVDGKSKS